jgi:hypothetical protein
MFREANTIARKFVRPVVIARRQGDGNCSAGIGSYVVINSDGWVVTAYHIIEQLQKLLSQRNALRAVEAEKLRIRDDATLEKKPKQKAIAALRWPPESERTTDCAAWWGRDGMVLRDISSVPGADVSTLPTPRMMTRLRARLPTARVRERTRNPMRRDRASA